VISYSTAGFKPEAFKISPDKETESCDARKTILSGLKLLILWIRGSGDPPKDISMSLGPIISGICYS
jgi:hypothetical protein